MNFIKSALMAGCMWMKMTFSALCNIEIPEPEPLVEEIIDEGDVSLISAEPKVGKSIFSKNIAHQLSIGGMLLGKKCAKRKVMCITLEEKPSVVKDQFLSMGASSENKDLFVSFTKSEDILKDIEEAHLDLGIEVFIIDTFIKAFTIKDISSYTETNSVFQRIQNLRAKYNLTLILIHHAGKKRGEDGGSTYLGSTGIHASVDNLISLRKKDGKILLSTSPKANAPIVDLHVPINFETFRVEEGATESFSLEDRYRKDIINYVAQSKSCLKKDIVSNVSGKDSKLYKAISSLIEDKTLYQDLKTKKLSIECPTSFPIGKEARQPETKEGENNE